MYRSLFPDFLSFEETAPVHDSAQCLAALEQVELEWMAHGSDHRMVVRRLAEDGVRTARQLLDVQREEWAERMGVGPTFLAALDELRAEVFHHPGQLIARWVMERALLILPDDLDRVEAECPALLRLPRQISSDTELTAGQLFSGPLEPCVPDTVQEHLSVADLERTFIALFRILVPRMDERGELLCRYFLEGLPVSTIVRVEGLHSPRQLYRFLARRCLRPLFAGESVCGVRWSTNFLAQCTRMRSHLLFQPLAVLHGLQLMSPERWLSVLGLSVLRRTRREGEWPADLIVPRYAVQRARNLLHLLLQRLYRHPAYCAVSALTLGLPREERAWASALLHHHPWCEHRGRGVRLVTAALRGDALRVARILHDAGTPLTRQEVLLRYERCYFERPQSLSLIALRRHFPQIAVLRRNLWQWKAQ